MNFFTPGLRELGRKVRRCTLRLALWRRRRQLAKAQTALGLLGWQQADFDPETHRQVEAINNVEREQGRLINEAAERSAEIRRLRSELEAAKRAHYEEHQRLAEEERKLREQRPPLERKLAEKRKNEPNFERQIPDLDRELREVNKLLSELLSADRHTPKVRQEITLLRERTVAIPNEKSDLRTQHFRIVNEIRSLEDALEENAEAAEKQAHRLREVDAAWTAREREMANHLKDQEREKARTEKRIAELESAKSNPYQQIGRVLAIANVAPMNQPDALERVKELEHELGETEQELLESQALSGRENAEELKKSYWVLGAAGGGFALVLFAALT